MSLHQCRVLVIDDSIAVCRIIEGILRREGCLVHSYTSGVAAVQALARHEISKPQVVILDVGLPVLDGYGVARLLHQHPEFRDLPIVMVSGRDKVFDWLRVRLAGAQLLVTKPFRPGDIIAAVSSVLSLPPRSSLPAGQAQ